MIRHRDISKSKRLFVVRHRHNKPTLTHNEEGVGEAVSKCGVPRDELFLTTKIWISNGGYEKAKASIDESLRKLKTDYVDARVIIGLS